MQIAVLQFPPINQETEIRPKRCPYCAGETFERWGNMLMRRRGPPPWRGWDWVPVATNSTMLELST
jgi:hypothetical protein